MPQGFDGPRRKAILVEEREIGCVRGRDVDAEDSKQAGRHGLGWGLAVELSDDSGNGRIADMAVVDKAHTAPDGPSTIDEHEA